jgi:hypothetical protein
MMFNSVYPYNEPSSQESAVKVEPFPGAEYAKFHSLPW